MACPECGGLPQIAGSAADTLGYRLATDLPEALDIADSAALPAPQDPTS
jgi:hypothetical protein